MNETPRPKLPSETTPASGPAATSGTTYNQFADKVGLVPNLRKKDNVYQAICVLAFVAIGVGIGAKVSGWPDGVLVGALAGLVFGGLLSGFVLMVLGLIRKS